MMGEDKKSVFGNWLAAYENHLNRIAKSSAAADNKPSVHALDNVPLPDSARSSRDQGGAT